MMKIGQILVVIMKVVWVLLKVAFSVFMFVLRIFSVILMVGALMDFWDESKSSNSDK